MTKPRLIAPDVYVAEPPTPAVAPADLEQLVAALPSSKLGRVRLCTHPDVQDRLHEMFIAFAGSTYVRPGHHVGKDESLHLLRGSGDCHFFDPNGRVEHTVSLGPYASDLPFYCRVPATFIHAMVPRTDQIAAHEATVGPFRPADNIPASWAPEVTDGSEVEAFLEPLRQCLPTPSPPTRAREIADGLLVPETAIVALARTDIRDLTRRAVLSDSGAISLRAQESETATLIETFVIRRSNHYQPPRRFPTRATSIHMLEGDVDVILFRADGAIDHRINLGRGDDAHRPFYLRVPPSTWHAVIPRSPIAAWHEVTAGPTVPGEPSVAPWAPDGSSPREAERWLRHLDSLPVG